MSYRDTARLTAAEIFVEMASAYEPPRHILPRTDAAATMLDWIAQGARGWTAPPGVDVQRHHLVQAFGVLRRAWSPGHELRRLECGRVYMSLGAGLALDAGPPAYVADLWRHMSEHMPDPLGVDGAELRADLAREAAELVAVTGQQVRRDWPAPVE